MLHKEYQIENYAHESKAKFDWITNNAVEAALLVSIQQQLAHRQNPSREIQDESQDGKPFSRLSQIVFVYLGHVLEEGYKHFDVR